MTAPEEALSNLCRYSLTSGKIVLHQARLDLQLFFIPFKQWEIKLLLLLKQPTLLLYQYMFLLFSIFFKYFLVQIFISFVL